MSEYTTSPGAIRLFTHSQDRTQHWVHSHDPYNNQFISPSIPPSATPYEDYGEHDDSDGDSTHSLPPKMVLKYGHGRPDIPISHWHYDPGHHRDEQASRDRTRSIGGTSHRHTSSHGTRSVNPSPLEGPEDIQIFPSDPNVLPFSDRRRRVSEPPAAREPPPHSHHGHAQSVAYSQSAPLPAQYAHHPPHHHGRPITRGQPPAMYSTRRHGDHHKAPTMVYAPHGAPGMTYTVSDPTGPQVPGYPRVKTGTGSRGLGSVHEHEHEQRSRRHRTRSPHGPRSRTPAPSEGGHSAASGSTYYVIPTPGQKVKVVNTGTPSLHTASSSTKSGGSSPQSRTSQKRPFFSRLFSFATSKNNSSQGQRLQRRYSLDGARGRTH
ncbi:hypothetical protein CONPUDRAFT_134655 [Coniophora puteana RWD-64-598 SS2]|uniref:Uncharacterized protein n=1 Tax=Coniophora puteana (strain RWD-64-598) TaxID=741705 RepID=A0A5M3N0D1_CONPW|nr:uncharacterized protein CONPUDRAFT_134655 [Coniophora puteana RWD-64-598 SS2]EIW84726.1 hypothetical protein CONPUDRAFT_134655 [Coniophora puteana RWD-64-598 SS2]